jgi:hypothetical protein
MHALTSFCSTPPLNAQGLFWIDPDKDFPAHALIRRIPSPEAQVLYFSCDTQAELALKHRAELAKDIPAELIGLPKFADTHAGPGVLLRLNHLWGHPAKRRFRAGASPTVPTCAPDSIICGTC